MMNKVMYFEIPFDDKERAGKFYSDIFGWQITDYPMPDGSVHTGARTTPTDEETYKPLEVGSINGSMVPRTEVNSSPVVTMVVDSIDESLKRIEASGGHTLTPRQEIEGMGSYAYFKDPEGNVIGLWEDPKL